MKSMQVTEAERRLAGELGLEPDDPFVRAMSQVLQKLNVPDLPALRQLQAGQKCLDLRLARLEGALRKTTLWVPIALAIALGGLCYFFGYQQGFGNGQVEVAGRWFDGVDNADYWKQMRQGNREAVLACQQRGQAECVLVLPQAEPRQGQP